MNIIKAHAVKNLCYIANKKMIPKGIVVHSTGANNPNLCRYVDRPEEVGINKYGNHWNQEKPSGRKVCVHAFIGYDKDKNIRVAEILPLDICCWGVGSGKNGSYNYDPAYIQFEICEDSLTDKAYYNKAFSVAAEYCAHLCKEYGIPVEKIVGHVEAYKQGYGSNHGDPEHWMKRFGENMDNFREKVSKLLGEDTQAVNINAVQKTETKSVTDTIKKGDLVSISFDATYYNGKSMPKWVKALKWYVKDTPKGDRVVIDKSESGKNSICSPVNAKYLKIVKSCDSSEPNTEKKSNCPYLVRIAADSLDIYKGAGTNLGKNGCITDKGVYTIVAESEGKGAALWGKLKSGAGWISLDYTKKLKRNEE